MNKNFKVVAFDADDTLWVNEPYYRESEAAFCRILSKYVDEETANHELYKTEMKNLPLYGYGTKGFMLSMVETALSLTQYTIEQHLIEDIINIGRCQLEKSIELLENVEDVLKQVSKKYRLILATKGDLLDQETKLNKSGLAGYFHHIEIMSEKKPGNYKKLIKHLDIEPHEFLMVGNSVKSDILPVIELGGSAIYIPYHTVWAHEKMEDFSCNSNRCLTVESIAEIVKILL